MGLTSGLDLKEANVKFNPADTSKQNFNVSGANTAFDPTNPLSFSSPSNAVSGTPNQSGGTPNAKLPFLQAVNQGGQTPMNPNLSKGGKLLAILGAGLKGGLYGQAAVENSIAQSGGHTSGGFGIGFMGAQMGPLQVQRGQLENSMLGAQVANIPFTRALMGAQLQNEMAKTGQTLAQTEQIPIDSALKQAQTEAAFYKDDPNVGLVDLRTGQPVNKVGLAPLTAEEAQVLGKQPGEQVPLKLKNMANEIVNRGIHVTSANGRQVIVDNSGKQIADLGAATPMVTMGMQLGGFGGNGAGGGNVPGGQYASLPKEMQSVVDAIGSGRVDLSTAISPYRRFPGRAQQLMGALTEQYPNYAQQNYDVIKKLNESFTSGSQGQSLQAIQTARAHMKTFMQIADALENGNWQTANKLGQSFGMEFGDDKATNFLIASQVFAGEFGKALAGAGVTEGDRKEAQGAFNYKMSRGQFKGAVQTVDELLAGKQKTAKDTYEKGLQGKPNFGPLDNNSNNGGDPLGIR